MSYLVVVEKAPDNYCAFVSDVPGAVEIGKTEDTLRSVSESISLHLEDMPLLAPRAKTRADAQTYVRDELGLPGLASEDKLHFVEPAPMNPVAAQVEAARNAANLTQAEFARRLGMARSNVSRLENPFYWGHSLKTLKRVADALEQKLQIELPRSWACVWG